MNVKTWLPITAAVILGLLAAKLGRDLLSQQQPAKAPAAKFAQVVVAKDAVAAGSALRAENLAVNPFPEGGVPSGAFRSVDELVGRVVGGPLVKGQPVLESSLAPVGAVAGLPALVPDGMRAVTVEVNETSGVAGMLSPGYRVDLVTTLSGDQGAPAVAKTVARNLVIFAVGRRLGGSGPGEPEGPPARSVTLLATPKEAEVVELACRLGNPRLILRGNRESHDGDSEGTTMAELRGTNSVGGLKNLLASLLAPATRPATAAAATASGQAPATQPSAQVPAKQYKEVQMIKGTVAQTIRVEIEPPKESRPADVADLRSELEPAQGGK